MQTTPVVRLLSYELLVMTVLALRCIVGGEMTPSKQLDMDLINNYGPRHTRPVKHHNTSMTVYFRAKPIWFADFDERQQVLTFVSWDKYSWTDDYLTWNPVDYAGIEETQFPKDQFWFPDITASERIGTESSEVNIEPPSVTVNYRGEAVYYRQAMISAFCKMDVTLFPYDRHACTIRYLLYSYSNDRAQLFYSSGQDAQEDIIQKNGVWAVSEIEVNEVDVKYLCCPVPYSEVHLTLYIQRESGFYILNMGLPTFLLSLTTLSVFLLHPESGEKVSLCVNNVLALIIFQQLLAYNMPPSGDHTPVVAYYFAVMITISFLSVLTTCMTLGIYHSKGTRPLSRRLKKLLFMGNSQSGKGPIPDESESVIVNDGLPPDWTRLEETAETTGGDRPPVHPRGRRRSSGFAKRDRESSRRNLVGATSGLTPIDVNGADARDPTLPAGNHEDEWAEAAIRIDLFLFFLSASAMILTTIYCAVQLLRGT